MGGQGAIAPVVLAEPLGYLPFGPLNSLTWGNGLTLSRTFDQSYRLTGQQVGSWSSDYAFDANGNITGLDHSLWGSLQYGYDALDRLTLEQKAAEKTTYAYDATGNRTERVTSSLAGGVETQTAKQSLKYNTTRNRLSQRSTSYAVEVDVAGNYTRYSQNRRYTYDEQGRLSTVTDADGGLMATYRYNALGQRVLKTLPSGASWTFLYGPDGQLLGQEQYSASGSKLKGQYWIWLDAMPLAGLELSFNSTGAVSSSNLYYLHADHLNTPRLASNQNQALIWSWNSDAFGVGAANQDVDGNGITTDIPLRFPGQQYDAHSALHYNYFRDYDPETGRYVESDPIGLKGGLNTFGYVEGNPIGAVDPNGLMGSTGVKSLPKPPPPPQEQDSRTCEQKAEDMYQECKAAYSTLTSMCSTYIGAAGGFGAAKYIPDLISKGVSQGTAVVGGLQVGEQVCERLDNWVNTENFCQAVKSNTFNRCEQECLK